MEAQIVLCLKGFNKPTCWGITLIPVFLHPYSLPPRLYGTEYRVPVPILRNV